MNCWPPWLESSIAMSHSILSVVFRWIFFLSACPTLVVDGVKSDVGGRCLGTDNKRKKCIITIQNKDSLCCARAIVTTHTHCHKHQGMNGFRDWENLRNARPVQARQARALHEQASVPEGPCSLEELHQFHRVLSPHYQLLVMYCTKHFFLVFKGPDAPHQIRLLKPNDHYDGCTSFPAFVNCSYWCVDCEKGFNTNDATNHPCPGKNYQACGRTNCADYLPRTRPTVWCQRCNGRFYGPTCFVHHASSKLCDQWKTCSHCQAGYRVVKGKPHRCGFTRCPCCHEVKDLWTHRCFIQPSVDSDEEGDDEEDGEQAPLDPLFVSADIEAM